MKDKKPPTCEYCVDSYVYEEQNGWWKCYNCQRDIFVKPDTDNTHIYHADQGTASPSNFLTSKEMYEVMMETKSPKQKIRKNSSILLIDMFIKDIKDFYNSMNLTDGLHYKRTLDKLVLKWEENKEELL